MKIKTTVLFLFLTSFDIHSQTIQTVYDYDNNYIGTLMGNWEHSFNEIQVMFDDGYYMYIRADNGLMNKLRVRYESNDCTGQGYSGYYAYGRVFLLGDNANQNSYRIFRSEWEALTTEKTFYSVLNEAGVCQVEEITETNYSQSNEITLEHYNIYFDLPNTAGFKAPLKLKAVNIPIYCNGFEQCSVNNKSDIVGKY